MRGLVSAGFPVTENRKVWGEERRELLVQARDWPSWYRVTVELVEPSQDELSWQAAAT